MIGRFHLRGLILGLAALAAPTLAQAKTVAATRNASAKVVITPGIQLRKQRDLNFASLAVTAAGTAVINPDTDVMTTTGGVTYAGGLAYAAQFEAVSPVKSVVLIRVPRNSILVTRVGGTETMTISNWLISGGGRRTVAAQEAYTFRIGGTLTVNTNQAAGLYLGTFDVEIQYP
jgi:hypothetical protein